MDHWIPIVSPECRGHIALNVVPMCRACNSSKNDRHPVKWLNERFGFEGAFKVLLRVWSYFNFLKSRDAAGRARGDEAAAREIEADIGLTAPSAAAGEEVKA